MASKDQDGVLSLQEFVRVLRALGKPCKLFNWSTPKLVSYIFYWETTMTAPWGKVIIYQTFTFNIEHLKQIRTAKEISVDQTNHSVSFNEFLSLNGKYKTTTNPSEQLLECFEMFDTEKTGTIPETVFRRIMTRKNGQIHVASIIPMLNYCPLALN